MEIVLQAVVRPIYIQSRFIPQCHFRRGGGRKTCLRRVDRLAYPDFSAGGRHFRLLPRLKIARTGTAHSRQPCPSAGRLMLPQALTDNAAVTGWLVQAFADCNTFASTPRWRLPFQPDAPT